MEIFMRIKSIVNIVVLSLLLLTIQACGDGSWGRGSNTPKDKPTATDDETNSTLKAALANITNNSTRKIGNHEYHSNISDENDTFFANLTYEEKLCKKYLGQPQTPNLTIPETYAEGIEYLSKALFFFPDDPKQMTNEQKELYRSSCFWSGMKVRFIRGGNVSGMGTNKSEPREDFNDTALDTITEKLDYYRYFLFTHKFFNEMFNQTIKKEFCDRINNDSKTTGDPMHGPVLPPSVSNNSPALRDCQGDMAFYSNGVLNDYFSIVDNTSANNTTLLNASIASSPFIPDMEALFVLRNMRFGSDDGFANFSNVKNLGGANARGEVGHRGYHDNFNFTPEKVIETIDKYGELAINIGHPRNSIAYPVGTPIKQASTTTHYMADYSFLPNEDPTTNQIIPNVQYWGLYPASNMYISTTDDGLLLHEMLHNMGYLHGNVTKMETIFQNNQSALDIPYYVQYLFSLEQASMFVLTNGANVTSMYVKDLQDMTGGSIPRYYNTTEQRKQIDVDNPNTMQTAYSHNLLVNLFANNNGNINCTNCVNSTNVTNSVNVINSNNVTNSTNVTNSSNVANSNNVANSSIVTNSTNVTGSLNVTNATNVTNSVNIANANNITNTTNTTQITNFTPVVAYHTDMVNDTWFAGLTPEEKLCKKYLGQPQTPNLAEPKTYNEAIDYLGKALFFLPDDPATMTQEQKDLFNSDCFWSGVKAKLVYNGKNMQDFSAAAKDEIEKKFSMYRYIMFTKNFYNKTFDLAFQKEYCTKSNIRMNWFPPPPSPYHDVRDCSQGTYHLYIENKSINDFYDRQKNTPLNAPIKNSVFITEFEYYLVIRHIRFPGDGYEQIMNKQIPSAGLGQPGNRGVYKVDPLEIIKTIQQMGEIGIDIGIPSGEAAGIGQFPTYSMLPNENTATKNIVPNVSYWGMIPGHELILRGGSTGDDSGIIHEMLHNMGYNHDPANMDANVNKTDKPVDLLDKAGEHPLDIAYFVQYFMTEDYFNKPTHPFPNPNDPKDIWNLSNNWYWVVSGAIPNYYHNKFNKEQVP